jgi:EAL domain-containing protein (putative c-di-GMP-specific phosphodiesterase class I)/DNA-binding response OmpR family regulator
MTTARVAGSPQLSAPAGAILVVDDDDAVRGVIALGLRRAGFEVIEASSGEAALEAVRTESVCLVVLDVGMPGISGIEVVDTLRSSSETATLPVLLMTGSADERSAIDGLGAGADDFLAKPVRIGELIARAHAHLRRQVAWSLLVEDELRVRARVVEALGRLVVSPVPEVAAETLVRELSTRTESDTVAVLQVGPSGELHELATYDRLAGVRRGGHPIAATAARDVLARARAGPWVEDVVPSGGAGSPSIVMSATPELSAGAPIYAGDDLVGILTIGVDGGQGRTPLVRRARLLAAAIDYAGVLSTIAGSALADSRFVAATRVRLRRVLTTHAFHPELQPIVDLATGYVVGFEALTRFHDGTPPDVRFAEAERGGLGVDFELATIAATLDGGAGLPDGLFLSINVSPGLVVDGDQRFRKLISGSPRPLILELTEHVPIEDYRAVRDALGKLGDIGLAVDDAGAGYASLRHILELRPDYAKLDMSLVRGIDADDVRQALAAGLQYFASRTGCRLIAEGVETSDEADVLRRLGIEYGQGHLFGRPAVVH